MDIAWHRFLQPRVIVVVGASGNPAKNSGRIIPALHKAEFAGEIWAVNPKRPSIPGAMVVDSISAVPLGIDVAIITVPAPLVVSAVKELAARNVGFAVILSAGFSEIGSEGQMRERELKKALDRSTMRVYGPNCPGVWMVADKMAYTFSPAFDLQSFCPGSIGLITQGGALGRAILDTMAHGVGFTYWFSPGNAVDLTVADFIRFLATDSRTRIVAAVIEGIQDGRDFIDAAQKCRDAGKPLVVLKLGRTSVGAFAAKSHTGSLTGADAVYEAVFKQCGVIRVDDIDELIDLVTWWERFGIPTKRGGGLGICGFSGGSGALMADLAADAGVLVPPLSPDLAAQLRQHLPKIASADNPADVTTTIFQQPELVQSVLEIFASDSQFDAIVFPFPYRLGKLNTEIAKHIVNLTRHTTKAVGALTMSPDFESEEAYRVLRQGGVPVFRSAREAARTLQRFLGTKPEHRLPHVEHAGNMTIPRVLDESQSRKVLEQASIPTGLPSIEVSELSEALEAAKVVGYPVALKGLVPGVSHKSVNGLVQLDIATEDRLQETFTAMTAPGDQPRRYLVQPMIPAGIDLLAGVRRDPVFGWIVIVGIGGSYAEYVADKQIGLLPLGQEALNDLILHLHIYPWIHGEKDGIMRDLDALNHMLLRLGTLPNTLPTLSEFEINPLRVFEQGRGVAVVDALAIVQDDGPGQEKEG